MQRIVDEAPGQAADGIDRLSPSREPGEKPIGYQCWTHLLFVHWRASAAELRGLVPPELTIDTFQGHAWVGLVPFAMSGVRPWWSPPVPGVSRFLETNLRTYVHLEGKHPGVWFFSLDASKSLGVCVGRWKWGLTYYRAEMSLEVRGKTVRYTSQRLWPGKAGVSATIEAKTGDLIGGEDSSRIAGCAAAGTLEHFLAERYVLYSRKPGGRICRGHVHHRPYSLREARLIKCDESLREAVGVAPRGKPEHVLACDGVSVKIYPLHRVE